MDKNGQLERELSREAGVKGKASFGAWRFAKQLGWTPEQMELEVEIERQEYEADLLAYSVYVRYDEIRGAVYSNAKGTTNGADAQ